VLVYWFRVCCAGFQLVSRQTEDRMPCRLIWHSLSSHKPCYMGFQPFVSTCFNTSANPGESNRLACIFLHSLASVQLNFWLRQVCLLLGEVVASISHGMRPVQSYNVCYAPGSVCILLKINLRAVCTFPNYVMFLLLVFHKLLEPDMHFTFKMDFGICDTSDCLN
jgi:hypothetical protein